jgi:hypothetical protein
MYWLKVGSGTDHNHTAETRDTRVESGNSPKISPTIPQILLLPANFSSQGFFEWPMESRSIGNGKNLSRSMKTQLCLRIRCQIFHRRYLQLPSPSNQFMGAPSVVTASVEYAPDNVVTLPSNALSNPLALQSEIMSSFPDIEGISAGLDWFDV